MTPWRTQKTTHLGLIDRGLIMACTTNLISSEENVQSSIKTSPRRKGKRATVAADQARRVAYEAFADSVRNELKPKAMFETFFVDRAILSAWRLTKAIEEERAGVLGGMGVDSQDIYDRVSDELRRRTDRIERSLRRALDSLESVRATSRAANWGQAIKLNTTVVPVEPEPCADIEILPNEWTILPDEHFADDVTDHEAPAPRWQDRLMFDPNVSDQSPVIKGTWITVSQIVTRIVDGFTWADILRSHPELTEEDIRICLSYATEQESDESKGVYLP